MKQWLVVFFLLLSFPASVMALTLQSQPSLSIDHSGLRCWPRGEFVQIEAQIETHADIENARVFFRSDKYPDFYFVEMEPGDDVFRAVMPIPSQETEKVIYYLEVVDRSLNSTRTEEFDPGITSKTECAVLRVDQTPGIVVGSLRVGAPKIPPGFLTQGIIGALGASAAAGAGASSSGGGLSGTAIGAIAGGAAAGVGAAVAVSGGDSTSSMSTSVPAPPTTTVEPTGEITLVGTSPPRGSTISIGQPGEIIVNLTVSIVYSKSGNYFLHSAIPDVPGISSCVHSGLRRPISLTAGQPATFTLELFYVTETACPLPIVNREVFVSIEEVPDSLNFLLSRFFQLNYTFVK